MQVFGLAVKNRQPLILSTRFAEPGYPGEPRTSRSDGAVITKMGGRVVVEAETAEAAQEKVERKGYTVLQVSCDASSQALSF